MNDDLYLKCQCGKGSFASELMVSFHTTDGAEKFCFVPKENVIVEEEPSRLKHPKGLVKIALQGLSYDQATVRVMGSEHEVRDYVVDARRITKA